MILKTKTGGAWSTLETAFSPVITCINDKGCKVETPLTIKGIAGTHYEFGELKTDLTVVDAFGDEHEICEDFISQHPTYR